MTISSLSVIQIRALPAATIATWTEEDVAQLSTVQIQALSSGQVGALEPDSVAALSTTQVGAIAPRAIVGFSLDKLDALATDRVSGLGGSQVAPAPPRRSPPNAPAHKKSPAAPWGAAGQCSRRGRGDRRESEACCRGCARGVAARRIRLRPPQPMRRASAS
jgi:hypothetical protein